MVRSKQEVRTFLDGLTGKTCVDKSNHALNGQCVCLIKCLMEFLGVSNPYGARGNAKDVGDSYIREGIGVKGQGWLTICVNRDMGLINGIRYGHVWIDLNNEANYESNGTKALITTKNTRPISQAQQFINFDKWITSSSGGSTTGAKDMTPEFIRAVYKGIAGVDPSQGDVDFHMSKSNPTSFVNGFFMNNNIKWQNLEKTVTAKDQEIANLKAQLASKPTTPAPSTGTGVDAELKADVKDIKATLTKVFK